MGKFKSLIPSALGGLLFLSAGLTACGDKSTSSVSAPSVDPNQIVMLKGSGATFPAPLYQKWIQEYSSTDDKKKILESVMILSVVVQE